VITARQHRFKRGARWLDARGRDGISTFLESSKTKMQPDHVIRALGALAQEHRLAAFRLLVEAGPQGLSAGAIAQGVGAPPSSMSFHLAQLANAGLVTHRRASRSIIYAADFAAMNGLVAYLTDNCCGGADCLAPAACEPAPAKETAP
jgi:DNA-binding transcriptional ArsR family regulator